MTDVPAPPDVPLRAQPTPPPERIVHLDVVRGVAVLGILVMNIVEFGLPIRAYENPTVLGGSSGLDLWTWFVQVTLFDGKMRALFSMLFGAGLVLIADRLQRAGRGSEAADLLLRRCLWLVPFGIAHRFLLQWTGDILYMYGLLGLIAVALRRLRPRTQIVLGLLCLAAFTPIELLRYRQADEVRQQAVEAERLQAANETVPQPLHDAKRRWERRLTPPQAADVQAEIDAMRGDYPTVFAYRWDYHHSFQSSYLYYYFVWDVLGMMLLGMAFMRLGFFDGRLPTWIYAATIGVAVLAAGATFVLARAWAHTGFSGGELELRAARGIAYPFTRGLVGLGWGAAWILLVRHGALRWLTSAVAAVGRMAFSNYVLQTVCCTLWFFGYGLGHYGEHGRAELMLVWLAVSLIQVGFSLAWLRVFRFGPLEWLWRALTYGQLPPLLRSAESPPVPGA